MLDDLKLIQRRFTLPDLLMAMVIKGIYFKITPIDTEDTDVCDMKVVSPFVLRGDDDHLRWILTKSVLEQSESTKLKLIEVLQ